MVSVFDYQNYRHFLADFLQEKKKSEKGFTQRDILRRMGISSSGFLSNIIAGRNNLTTTQIASLVRALNLKKEDAAYFEAVVLFTQAKTIEEKDTYLSRMVHLHKAKYKTLGSGQLSLFAKWHYAVIREIMTMTEFRDDYKWLAQMVTPPITPAQAKDAVHELESIGLVKRDESGVYRPQEGAVTTGDEVRSLHVARFHLETMKHAQKSLDTIAPQERDISTLTLRLSDAMIKQMKNEIQLFRKKLLRMAQSDTDQQRIYQCNINFFPVSKQKGE